MGAIHITAVGNSAPTEQFGDGLSILQNDGRAGSIRPFISHDRLSHRKFKRSDRNFEAFPFSVLHTTVVICHYLNSAAGDDK
jgi:hypothetical protein